MFRSVSSLGIKKNHPKFGQCEEYVFRNERGGSFRVYTVRDLRCQNAYKPYYTIKDVGILVTKLFYIFFDWNRCYIEDQRILDLSKLKGVMELAHGNRTTPMYYCFSFKHNPFIPPSGDWTLYWKGPHGSVNELNVNEYQLIDRLYGYWSRCWNKTEVAYYYPTRNRDPHVDFAQNICRGPKFANKRKLVAGTMSHDNRIMNYTLSALRNDDGSHISNAIGTVQCCDGMGYIFTRNRRVFAATLKDLLKLIVELDLPRSLIVGSCRNYNDDDPVWNSADNCGPCAVDIFNLKVPMNLGHTPITDYSVKFV
ncbi:MAG: hypothetical protein GY750_09115 [Lentisphaerae bacterium]|nr:hypothetical protein [Lentisphaerota bacterium]MCP4101571.1 hypothetical protein [Lentisphaerota bacterium]